ncbi:MAG: hypothetical protein Q8Q69_03245 [Nitrosopumilaceae archaeon]|nr:hypothetical protein [Nitrosopumilaceae archaeon]
MLGSWLCPCGCGHDIITGKKHFDITDVKSFLTYRLRDSKLPQELKIPDKWKKEGLNPIEIAEKVFGKKLVLVPVT